MDGAGELANIHFESNCIFGPPSLRQGRKVFDFAADPTRWTGGGYGLSTQAGAHTHLGYQSFDIEHCHPPSLRSEGALRADGAKSSHFCTATKAQTFPHDVLIPLSFPHLSSFPNA